MGWLTRAIKKEWQRNKQEWSEIKTEAREWKDEAKRDFKEMRKEQAEAPSLKDTMREIKSEWKEVPTLREHIRKEQAKAPTFKETMQDIKSEWKKQPSLKEVFQENKEKRRRKEAEYNPSGFTRIMTAASICFTSIIAIMLIPTIIGIPISALIFGMNVWAWRKYVTKKPETSGSAAEIEELHKRIEELERSKREGSN